MMIAGRCAALLRATVYVTWRIPSHVYAIEREMMEGSKCSRCDRVARLVAEMLFTHPPLAPMRAAGYAIKVVGTETMISAQAISILGADRPQYEARITSIGWWEPDTSDHLRPIVTELGAELRRQWDLR